MSQEVERPSSVQYRKRIRTKWKRRNRMKLLKGLILASLIIAGFFMLGTILFDAMKSHRLFRFLNKEPHAAPPSAVAENKAPPSPLSLPQEGYKTPVSLDKDITIALNKVTVFKDGMRVTLLAEFLVNNPTPAEFRLDPRNFDLIDNRGYSYFREVDKSMLDIDSKRFTVRPEAKGTVEVAFFLNQDGLYNQLFLVVSNRRILVKQDGMPAVKMVLGDRYTYESPQW